MIPCQSLFDVEKRIADACAKLDLPVPVAVRSAEYDRIEVYLYGWSPDEAAKLRETLVESLKAWSRNWDAWVVHDGELTLCVAESETPEDSE